MMLNSSYILVTRPEDAAEDYAKELRDAGLPAMTEPMLEIRPLEFSAPDPASYQGLIFTSPRAVKIFAPHADKSLPVFAVGMGTEAQARAFGFANIITGGGDGHALVNAIKQHFQKHNISSDFRLLHPRGEDAAVPVDEILKTYGIKTAVLLVYKADLKNDFSAAIKKAFSDGVICAVTFFSKRSAKNFCDLIIKNDLQHKMKTIKALCISEAVLECTGFLDWRDTYIAETPDSRGMTAIALQACAENPQEILRRKINEL